MSSFRKAKHAQPVRKAIAIVHPHTYSNEAGGREQPEIVSTKMEALDCLPPNLVPDYVLSAGMNAAHVRRESQRRSGALRRKGSTFIPLDKSAPPSVLESRYFLPTPTDSCTTFTSTIPETIPDVLPPSLESTEPTKLVHRVRKGWTSREEHRRKPFYRHFVFVWKRVTGFARRLIRVGPDGQAKREPWLPADFVLIDPRSSWWKKQSSTSRASKNH